MSAPTSASIEIEPGSFRDRNGRVFYRNGEVYRCLSKEAALNWYALVHSKFFNQALEKNQIIPTEVVDASSIGEDLPHGNWEVVLHHHRVPVISYPYEWSFAMLKDAALLHLELLQNALAEDMILKDSSAFNVQWQGT